MQIININRGRVNLALTTLAFTVSSAGSVLLHIVFAIAIYKETNSGFITSIFVSLQWFPMLFVILYRSDWDHGMNPRKRWYLVDYISAILTLPILFFVDDSNYLIIVFILFFRGILDQIGRINKTIASRLLYPPEKITHYSSFLQTGYHLGIGIAAISGIYIANYVELKTIVWIDALTFIISGSLILFTKYIDEIDFPKFAVRSSLKKRREEYINALNSDPRLLFMAILPPITATFFQGTYSVLQPILPIEKLGLGSSEVSISYILASVGILIGSSGFSFFSKRYLLYDNNFPQAVSLIIVLSFLACFSFLYAVSTSNILICAVMFTLMVILFEFLWMMGYAGIVNLAPKDKLGSVFGISFAIGCVGASLVVSLTGWLLDRFNNNYTATILLFMFIYLSIILVSTWKYKRTYLVVEEIV